MREKKFNCSHLAICNVIILVSRRRTQEYSTSTRSDRRPAMGHHKVEAARLQSCDESVKRA